MSDTMPVRIPWKPIEPLGSDDRIENGALAALDALRQEWQRRLDGLPEADRSRIRQRTHRRHAVETGILERLYDIDWGLTLTLVAEGFTRDVVERVGGHVDDRVLATLRAQMESLGMVLDWVRGSRPLGTSFIKELHQAMTRTQDTYIVTDSLGRVVEHPLPRGEWKREPNHVLRRDDTLLEYAPPEQVNSEMDRLIHLWNELARTSVHPVIKSAWLHHRFVQIHPFADGNGRIARALTLLVLEQNRYAPLVVDRWHRSDYLEKLDAANDGDLKPLIRLFIKLESAALTSELERPHQPAGSGLAVEVAHTLADQLAKVKKRRASEIQRSIEVRARAVGGHLRHWFESKREELAAAFAAKGLGGVDIQVFVEMPPSDKARWFQRQVIDSAHVAGHWADFSLFAGICQMRVRVEGHQVRYVASLHGAGRDPGVMAVTTFAEIRAAADDDDEAAPAAEPVRTTKDAFRFVHTESVDELDRRAHELGELLEEGLAEALAQLSRRI